MLYGEAMQHVRGGSSTTSGKTRRPVVGPGARRKRRSVFAKAGRKDER